MTCWTIILTSESSLTRPMSCEADLAAMPEHGNGAAAGLTGAELRLLPLLSTHLSFREIGEELFVSRNTIKTQAISVYREARRVQPKRRDRPRRPARPRRNGHGARAEFHPRG